MGKLCRPRQIIFVYTFAFADVSCNMCTTLRRFIRGRLVFFFEVAPGASPHIFVSKMMTSTQGRRKGKEKNAEPDPGTVVLSKLSMAASEARNATMASIAELVDDAAAKNGGRVPKGFIPKVIQQFSIVAPGLNRDKINYYRKEYEKKRERGALHGGSDIVTPESLLASSLRQDDDAGPPRKRQKGGRPKGTTVKSSQAEYDIYQKVCAEAARDFQNALDEVAKTGKCRMKKGLLDQIIQDVKTRHNVEHFEIPLATIRKRISRKNLAPPHRGLVSPMEKIEPMLVELCIRLGRARQPLKCKNFLPLVNSIIKGSLTEKEVIEFKARYSHGDENGLPDSLPLLQQCWRERRGRLSPPLSPANSDDESSEDEPPALPPPMGTTPAPAASITFNSPVDDVSTITEITIQEASGRSEERVADCEQGMMQRIEM